jgi:cytochrome c peroxidase
MVFILCFTLVFSGVAVPTSALAQENPFLSLKEVPVPAPKAAIKGRLPGLREKLRFLPLTAKIVKDEAALIRLGKALFWDMQVGSDGVMACATCHFNAGADIRSKNQLNPGILDSNFRRGSGGDFRFGNPTVPFAANDPLTPKPPGPSEPPPPEWNVPGLPQFRPNYQLVKEDFPLNEWVNPTLFVPRGPGVTWFQEFMDVPRDTNDVVSSMGVRYTRFDGIELGSAVDKGTPLPDIFNVLTPGRARLGGKVRRVEPRNAPTVINAVFNFDNFWDGRASFIFNGVNPFGFRDRTSTLKLNVSGVLEDVFVRITNSSLASQAVGPPTSDFEMSFAGRSFPDVGKKMVVLQPLAKQAVHPEDSVLGPYAKVDGNGLNIATYAEMIQAAFQDHWWNSTDIITVEAGSAAVQKPSIQDPRTMALTLGKTKVIKRPEGKAVRPLAANEFTQMEMNFSLFFGLAVQAYEATLISDDAPFDRYMGAPTKGIPPDANALTDQEKIGLASFMSEVGKCNNCHSAPIFTNHSTLESLPNGQGSPTDLVEFMAMGDGGSANYDKGMYNIGARRTTEDLGRAGTAPDAPPFRNPRDKNKPFPLSYTALAALKAVNKLPADVARFVPNIPVLDRLNIRGCFKVPGLRNIEFSGPYLHTGDSATLRQVVEFYVRGGNFPNTNFRDLDPDMGGIPEMTDPDNSPNAKAQIEGMVAFLSRGLTDQRVALEQGVFDHPQLFIPNGSPDRAPHQDLFIELPAVGRNGRSSPIPRFLDLDPQFSGD